MSVSRTPGQMRPALAPPSKGGETERYGSRTRPQLGQPRHFITLAQPPHSRVGRRVALVCAAMGMGCFAGCGVMRSNSGTSSPQSGNAIERRAQKGPVKLTVRVSPREPRLSDLVEMDVTVESQPEVEIKPPAFGQAVGDFLIRDYSERPPDSGAKNVRRFHYQLEPAHAGKHLIRSVSIEFVDKRANSERRGEPALIETDPLEVNVTSEFEGNAPSLANLEPMTPPQPVPQTFGALWLVAAGLASVLAIAAGVFVLRRRKRRPIEQRRQTPEEIAQAALALLLAEDLPGRGLVKEFYLRLTAIVRQYVEDTTGIRAPEQTTEEFLRDMRSHDAFPPERSVRLAEFLEAADLVKYAGQQPEQGQIDMAIARAHEFVNLKPAETAAMASATAG
jgi:LPXTG-motif cell wall-anchored protein